MPKIVWAAVIILGSVQIARCQSLGNYGSLRGVVLDGSGASVPSASITLGNPITAMRRTESSDSHGRFQINGIPFGVYHLITAAPGFQPADQRISIGSAVPIELATVLSVAGASTSLEVKDTAGGLDVSPTAHGTMDRSLLDHLPVQNQATGLSEMITRNTPGVASDGNGFAHPLGEHADTSLSIDNQPITDQQAKIFSNQISTSIIEAVEVVTGAPPAEFGDKTSLIVNVTTQSGLGKSRPFGTVSSQYGSFGTRSAGVTYGTGSAQWGNFAALNANASNRFLDTPEFEALHARGNAESVFDRFDLQPNNADSVHLNLSAARSWFQTPNTYDSELAGQDQRSQIRSFNIAPGWTHLINPRTLFTVNPFLRFDRSEYFPSANRLADRPATLSQNRYLMNVGFRADIAWSNETHNAKFGSSYWHTLLRERFDIALTDPAWNEGPDFIANLVPYDLTRGGSLYPFRGDADVRQLALYAQDSIHIGRLTMNPGLRYDRYNGLSRAHQLQPRFGLAYRVPWTNTILRLSYARLFETPYNENLIVASQAAANSQATNPFGTFRSSPPQPGQRNQFNAGLAQAIGRRVSFDADYFWKFTHNAFDFDSLFLTPVTFPIGWRKSKIDGLAARISVADFHGFSAVMVFGHTRSRFFGPETGGLVFNNVPRGNVFRIDHSEEFEQSTSLRYQYRRSGPWVSFAWHFNSGLALPGVAADYAAALQLTADEQAQIGLYCGNVHATRFSAITSCGSPIFGADRIVIPPPGKQNDDLWPTRVSPRNILDLGGGIDDLLHRDNYKIQLRLTALNLTNKEALYNFLSTFSGTHFVTPRTWQGEVRLVF